MIRKIIAAILISAVIICALPVRAETAGVSVCVMHKGSGKVCTDENALTPRPCAGLSHSAALLVISEAVEAGEFELSCDISVSYAASRIPGATAFIESGEVISAEALYKAAAIIGAGDAVYALGEAIGGSADKFTERINSRLAELGINCTYDDVTGTDIEMSAHDLALIGTALSDCECYTRYSAVYMDSITHANGKNTELVNPNRLVREVQGCKGLLTGSSQKAGYCGIFYTERNSCGYVCVVLGEKNAASRSDRAKTETEKCFSSYKETKIAEAGAAVITDYPVTGACVRSCDIVAAKNMSILTTQGVNYKCVYNLPDRLTAPVKAGDCVGNALYTDDDGNMLASVELTVASDIDKAGFFDFFIAIAQILCA